MQREKNSGRSPGTEEALPFWSWGRGPAEVMGSRTENTLCVNYYLPMLRTDICSGAWNFLLLSLDSTLRNPFKQVSSSFFLWATSGQGELLTARTGNWNSEGKVAITHDRVGRGNTIREVKPAAVCPGPPGCPQIRSCCLYHFRLLHTEGQLAEASPHWGSPMLRGPPWDTNQTGLQRHVQTGKKYV